MNSPLLALAALAVGTQFPSHSDKLALEAGASAGILVLQQHKCKRSGQSRTGLEIPGPGQLPSLVPWSLPFSVHDDGELGKNADYYPTARKSNALRGGRSLGSCTEWAPRGL